MAENALRILAVAYKKIEAESSKLKDNLKTKDLIENSSSDNHSNLEEDLVFVGLI
jgi:magnesium-transporting ATPase (P-type)